MSGTNTIAYWTHSQDTLKMKCCEYALWLLRVSFFPLWVSYYQYFHHLIIRKYSLKAHDTKNLTLTKYWHLASDKKLKNAKFFSLFYEKNVILFFSPQIRCFLVSFRPKNVCNNCCKKVFFFCKNDSHFLKGWLNVEISWPKNAFLD